MKWTKILSRPQERPSMLFSTVWWVHCNKVWTSSSICKMKSGIPKQNLVPWFPSLGVILRLAFQTFGRITIICWPTSVNWRIVLMPTAMNMETRLFATRYVPNSTYWKLIKPSSSPTFLATFLTPKLAVFGKTALWVWNPNGTLKKASINSWWTNCSGRATCCKTTPQSPPQATSSTNSPTRCCSTTTTSYGLNLPTRWSCVTDSVCMKRILNLPPPCWWMPIILSIRRWIPRAVVLLVEVSAYGPVY